MKRGLAALAVTALLVAAGVLVWTQSSGERSPLGSLESSSDKPLTIQMDKGVPRFMTGSVAVAGETATERSYAYLDRHSELYALDVPQRELEVVEVESGPAGQHVHLQQQQDEVPVYGGELVVHLEGEEVVSTGGTYLAEVPQLEPELGAEQVLDRAREAAGMKEAPAETKPELTYFDADLLMTPKEREASGLDGETHLAWKVDLGVRRAFVDAKTGEVLLSYDRIETHASAKNIGIGTANGRSAVGEGLFPCNIQGASLWFANGAWAGSPDAEGLAAHGFANQIYDYFYNTFHRHSFDERDTPLVFTLDYLGPAPLNGGNAAWIPLCQQIFVNDNMATLDLMAHEFTHGVIEHAVTGGLQYLFQSGALNESLADTFAMLIDTANWTFLERPGVTPARDISNPPAFNQPDKMPVMTFAANQDSGGVHTNSGIPNKAAYLLMQGGFHNDRIVQAIGRQKSALLYYEVVDNWLFTTANLSDFRNFMVSASSQWSNVGRNGFTAADACRVKNAFAAVALPPGDADCDGVLDGTDPDGDNDGLTDAFDNCDFLANPGQQASDTDGTGNACDTDDDADGLLDTADNCAQAANPMQEDTDKDGLGNACDSTPTGDSDFDGADNATDNCPGLPNPSQSNNDGDKQGDACDTDDDNDGIVDNADNCHQKANKDQADKDGDGVGNVCDPSPDGTDTDGDGTPDSADDDDDNDGVKDGSDNCRLVKNTSQIDLDHDGTGHECDSDESLTPQRPLLSDAIDQRTRRFERIEIPVMPCLERCEPDVPMEIRLEVDIPLTMRLLDESGTVIAEGSNEKPLVFEPKDDLQYQLEILPRDVTLTEDHPLELELVPRP